MRCSKLIMLAAWKFINRHNNRKILKALNEAYQDTPDPSEEALREGMLQHYRQLVKKQW
jgi:hypothetical protein